MTHRHYTIRTIALVIATAAIASCTHDTSRIIKSNTSEDGISVVFTENKDTFALDYLTAHELDSLSNSNHSCKWPECPYHGVKKTDYRAIVEYVGNYGTDAYYLDSLHLEYPNAEYEELETKLNTIK